VVLVRKALRTDWKDAQAEYIITCGDGAFRGEKKLFH